MDTSLEVKELNKRIGNNIRFRREQLGVSQEALAAEVEISGQSLMSQYENGRRSLPLPKLVELSDYFGVSLQELLFEEVYEKDENFKFQVNDDRKENRHAVAGDPILKCANQKYYGYYLKEPNNGNRTSDCKVSAFELNVLGAISSREAPVTLNFHGAHRETPISGGLTMDESYAYVVCHDRPKDWFWELTFYYYRTRQAKRYVGGMGMLRRPDFHLLPICQLCILSNKIITSEHYDDLKQMLRVKSSDNCADTLYNCDFSSTAVLRLTKEKDQKIFDWLRCTL